MRTINSHHPDLKKPSFPDQLKLTLAYVRGTEPQYYAMHAPSYDGITSCRIHMIEEIIDDLQLQSTNRIGTVLDIACGTGNTTTPFAFKGAKQVIGMDQSAPMLQVAQAKQAPNTEYRIDDLNTFSPAQYPVCDVVTCIGAARFIEDIELFYAKIYALLKPDGIFLFEPIACYSLDTAMRSALLLGLQEIAAYRIREHDVSALKTYEYTIVAYEKKSVSHQVLSSDKPAF